MHEIQATMARKRSCHNILSLYNNDCMYYFLMHTVKCILQYTILHNIVYYRKMIIYILYKIVIVDCILV